MSSQWQIYKFPWLKLVKWSRGSIQRMLTIETSILGANCSCILFCLDKFWWIMSSTFFDTLFQSLNKEIVWSNPRNIMCLFDLRCSCNTHSWVITIERKNMELEHTWKWLLHKEDVIFSEDQAGGFLSFPLLMNRPIFQQTEVSI